MRVVQAAFVEEEVKQEVQAAVEATLAVRDDRPHATVPCPSHTGSLSAAQRPTR